MTTSPLLFRLPKESHADSRLALLAISLQWTPEQVKSHIQKDTPIPLGHLSGMQLIEARRLLVSMGGTCIQENSDSEPQTLPEEPEDHEDILLMTPVAKGPAWPSLVGGIFAGLIIFLFFPMLEYGFSFILVPVHEMGHAFAYWLYGYPSIPAFDFNYGGGVTMHQERSLQVFWGLMLVEGLGVWYLRNYSRLQKLAAGFMILQLATAFLMVHEIVGLAAGHGMELLIMGVFIYRAIAGVSIVATGERFVYSLVGSIMWLHSARFAYRLLTSEEHRYLYEEAKGGGHWMDFSRIAEEFVNTSLERVAIVFLIFALLTPLIAWIAAISRTRWLP